MGDLVDVSVNQMDSLFATVLMDIKDASVMVLKKLHQLLKSVYRIDKF